MYPGPMTDENIRSIFAGAADFNVRALQCGAHMLYAYAIDGLISGNAASEYIIKPIMEKLRADTMAELYRNALLGVVVNSVARPCEDLDAVAASAGFSRELTGAIIGEADYEVRFFLLDALGRLENMFHR